MPTITQANNEPTDTSTHKKISMMILLTSCRLVGQLAGYSYHNNIIMNPKERNINVDQSQPIISANIPVTLAATVVAKIELYEKLLNINFFNMMYKYLINYHNGPT